MMDDIKYPIISMKNVGMRYGNDSEVLSDINLSLMKGGFYFLTGPSGSGKTSLLKMLYLDHTAVRGEVRILNHNVSKLNRDGLSNIRKRIGVVFQDYMLLNHLTVFDNVALPLRVLGKSEQYIQKHVVEMINWIDMGEHIYSKPAALSGGQQQRIAIARAVIHNPDILIADEPTASVDDHMAVKLLYLFLELNKRGTTIILSTHNKNLIEKFGDNPVIELEKGHIKEDSSSTIFGGEFDDDEDVALEKDLNKSFTNSLDLDFSEEQNSARDSRKNLSNVGGDFETHFTADSDVESSGKFVVGESRFKAGENSKTRNSFLGKSAGVSHAKPGISPAEHVRSGAYFNNKNSNEEIKEEVVFEGVSEDYDLREDVEKNVKTEGDSDAFFNEDLEINFDRDFNTYLNEDDENNAADSESEEAIHKRKFNETLLKKNNEKKYFDIEKYLSESDDLNSENKDDDDEYF